MAPRLLSCAVAFAVVSVLFAACGSESAGGGGGDALADAAGDVPGLPESDGVSPGFDGAVKEVLTPDVAAGEDGPVGADGPAGEDVGAADVPGADAGAPVECLSDADCADEDDCTADVCGPEGVCEHPLRTGFCHIDGECWPAGEPDPEEPCRACLPLAATDAWTPDDTLTCGTDDACLRWLCRGGACVSRPRLDCADDDPCTVDRCDGGGCVHDPWDGPCDDGDRCTRGDRCVGGVCTAGAEALPCVDGDPCTDDGCDPASGCVFPPRTGPCDDGDRCTSDDRCEAGACVGTFDADCDDDDGCTDDWCDPVHGCLHADNTAPCEDGDPATFGDRCVGRVCVPGVVMVCDDGNPCTDDDHMTGLLCEGTPNTDPCEDGNACTTGDACAGGSCVGGDPVDCSDTDPCTDEGCDPATGCWSEGISGGTCTDALACTVAETCADGACVGTPLACDDGNDCTADGCVEPLGCRADLVDAPECGLRVVVTEPPRGVQLNAAALVGGGVPVRGYVDSPADPAPTLTLNGTPLALTALPPADPPAPGEPNPGQPKRFTFDTTVAPVHAMNLLRLRAADSFARTAARVQSFYYSTVYHPVTAADFAASRIEAGVAIGLSQEFVDDNEPTVNDLASLVDLIIRGIDIGALIPSPASSLSELGCDYDLYVTYAQFSSTTTDIRIVADGLLLTLSLNALDIGFWLDRTNSNFWCPGDQTGSATATAARINARVRVSVVDGVVTAVLDEAATTAELIGLDVSVDSWFVDFILGFFEGTIQTMIEDQLEGAIQDQVEPLLATIFDALLLDVDIEIPPLLPGAQPAAVALRTRIAGLTFAADDHLKVELDAAVLAEHGGPYASLGALGYANCLEAEFTRNSVEFTPYARINLGLFDDVANQILHAAWETGAFELTLGPDVIPVDDLAQFGVADLDVAVSLLLPPVMTSCKEPASPDAPPDALVVELGDLQVDASLTLNGAPVDVLLYASLTGAARLGVAQDEAGATEIGIEILGFDEVETDIVALSAPDAATAALVGALIDGALVPLLLEQLDTGGPIGFALPVIDLSDPEAGIPEGTALAILPTEVTRTENANTVVKGTVVQAAP